jgi:shikimate dehydrogenase
MSHALYAVLGNPVQHSQSPFIHGMFTQATGEPVRYERVLCPIDGFESCVRDFAASGAGGCNVTVPFKFEALKLAADASQRARLAGAANVLRFDDGGWFADNTDGIGLVRDIEHHAGVVLRGRRVLLLGAGGAAAGVLGPLLEAGVVEVVVANRTASKAEALVERHLALASERGARLSACTLADCGVSFDIVLNSTAASMQGAGVPVADHVLRPGTLAVDLMYGRAAAPFVEWAESCGAIGRDGLGMLVEQAAEAFFVWRGVRPDTAPVLQALRAKLAGP